jgi:hypothetical protein
MPRSSIQLRLRDEPSRTCWDVVKGTQRCSHVRCRQARRGIQRGFQSCSLADAAIRPATCRSAAGARGSPKGDRRDRLLQRPAPEPSRSYGFRRSRTRDAAAAALGPGGGPHLVVESLRRPSGQRVGDAGKRLVVFIRATGSSVGDSSKTTEATSRGSTTPTGSGSPRADEPLALEAADSGRTESLPGRRALAEPTGRQVGSRSGVQIRSASNHRGEPPVAHPRRVVTALATR